MIPLSHRGVRIVISTGSAAASPNADPEPGYTLPCQQLGTLVLNHTVDELVALAEGTSILNPKLQREGVVLRPFAEEHDDDIGGRLSFKAINPKFLLKYDE